MPPRRKKSEQQKRLDARKRMQAHRAGKDQTILEPDTNEQNTLISQNQPLETVTVKVIEVKSSGENSEAEKNVGLMSSSDLTAEGSMSSTLLTDNPVSPSRLPTGSTVSSPDVLAHNSVYQPRLMAASAVSSSCLLTDTPVLPRLPLTVDRQSSVRGMLSPIPWTDGPSSSRATRTEVSREPRRSLRIRERDTKPLLATPSVNDDKFIKRKNLRKLQMWKSKRLEASFRKNENDRLSKVMRDKREDASFRKNENQRRVERLKNYRSEEFLRKKENARVASYLRKKRMDATFRKDENLQRWRRLQSCRSNEFLRKKDNLRVAEHQRKRRENITYRQDESQQRKERRIAFRADKLSRKKDNSRVAAYRAKNREEENKKRREREDRLEKSRRLVRLAIKRRQISERRKNSFVSESITNNPLAKSKKKFRDRLYRKRVRGFVGRRAHDNAINARSARNHRKLNHQQPFQKLLQQFLEEIGKGPTNVCCCCAGLFYDESCKKISVEKLQNWGWIEEDIPKVFCVKTAKTVCGTCQRHIRQIKVPKLSLYNGLAFPEIPNVLKGLNRLEMRLVALRIPFMQVRPLRYESQWVQKGNVVNVANDVDTVTQTLPRQFHDSFVVSVSLMRRSNYKHPYLVDKVRPYKIYQALKYLMDTPLYKEANVTLSPNYMEAPEDVEVPFIEEAVDTENQQTREDDSEDDANENDDENIDSIPPETLIYDHDNFANKTIRIAPGENNTPIPPRHDPNAERLAFPTIFCGQKSLMPTNMRITTTDIKKSQQRHFDRRHSEPEKVLFDFRESFNEKIINAWNICLRQSKRGEGGNVLTARDLKEGNCIPNLIATNNAYQAYKNIRGTPPYWSNQCKHLIAMVRTHGPATFFITLSAAETKWGELLAILHRLSKGERISAADAEKLPSKDRFELVRSDPTTCMRHFDRRYKQLLKILLKRKNGVFSPNQLKDYYSRVEFQNRGSPHSHGLYWFEGTPKYDPGDADSIKRCIEFIDQHITCERVQDGEIAKYMIYQLHQHKPTCRKPCRFGFPRPPLPETLILQPVSKEVDTLRLKKGKENFKKILERLTEMGRDYKEILTFDVFLSSINLSYDEYIFAIQTSIKRDTVFLRRRTCDIYINNYNSKLLLAWKANMDIQFVLNAYSCAKYCASYLSKGESGLSKLLRVAIRDSKRGNTQVGDSLKDIAKILMRGSEISAQEAAAFLLSLPCHFSSLGTIYINTALPEDRIGILKPKKELESLPDDSNDICQKGLIDHYVNRPEQLDETCLADFAALYQFSGKLDTRKQQTETEDDGEITVGRPMKLIDGSGYVTRRKRRKIIRFRHYAKDDQANYCREQIMLFVPWRDETKELLEIDTISSFMTYKDTIFQNSAPFYYSREVDDEMLGKLITEAEADDINELDEASCIENDMEVAEDQAYAESILTGKRIPVAAAATFLKQGLLEDNDYFKIMRSLNEKQRKIVMHVTHQLKCDNGQFRLFLTGGAGVGKSHVITAIVQTLERFCNKQAEYHPDDMPVLVTAPTGKAAFNVMGMTLHSAFKLPPSNYKGTLAKLDEGVANALRLKFRKLKLIIIDEISMVSSTQLSQIDHRLRQIFNTEEDFGGISVLAVGHLRQLPPVMGGKNAFVFQCGFGCRNPLWSPFRFYELTEIMRQQGQIAFCNALNNMAEGTMTDQDVNLMKTREISETLKPPRDAMRLFPTNKACEAFNKDFQRNLGTEGFESIAHDSVTGNTSLSQKECFLEDAKSFSAQKSDGMPYITNLQVGATYFVSTNVDVADGLFNGATGILRKIEYGETVKRERIPTVAWMEFSNVLIGSSLRGRSASLIARCNALPTWTPILRTTRELSASNSYKGMNLRRTQIPLVSANAMTVHKSQGSSIPCVVVNMKGRMSREMEYVACSRAMSLEGLYFDGKFIIPTMPDQDDAVSREMEILRTCEVLLNQNIFHNDSSRSLYFHNVETLPKYLPDLKADMHILSNSYIAIVEPHIRASHDVTIDGYACASIVHSREVTSTHTNSEGHVFYVKNGMEEGIVRDHSHRIEGERNKHCVIVTWKLRDINILVLYRHESYSKEEFFRRVTSVLSGVQGNIILVGDININMLGSEAARVEAVFATFNLQNVLKKKVSTNYGTQLDICFSNEHVLASITETYYSYHKGVHISW